MTAALSIDPGWGGIAAAFLMMVVVVAVAAWQGVNMIREGLVASARATVQLLAVGLILGFVFAANTWWAIGLVLLVMTLIAGYTATRRIDKAIRRLGPLFTLILAAVTAVTLIYVTQAAVGVHEVAAQYFIPIGGMILGNAMTAGTLAAGRYVDELRDGRERI